MFGRLLLAFIMVPLIRKELDIFRETVWNSNRNRAQRKTALPDGIPDHIYNFPEKYGLEECGMCHIILCLIMYNVDPLLSFKKLIVTIKHHQQTQRLLSLAVFYFFLLDKIPSTTKYIRS